MFGNENTTGLEILVCTCPHQVKRHLGAGRIHDAPLVPRKYLDLAKKLCESVSERHHLPSINLYLLTLISSTHNHFLPIRRHTLSFRNPYHETSLYASKCANLCATWSFPQKSLSSILLSRVQQTSTQPTPSHHSSPTSQCLLTKTAIRRRGGRFEGEGDVLEQPASTGTHGHRST